MSLDVKTISDLALQNPLIVGVLQKGVVDLIKSQLKTVDVSGQAVKYKGYVQPIVFVLTALVGVLSAAGEGRASAFDPGPLVTWMFTTYAATIATHKAVAGAKDVVNK